MDNQEFVNLIKNGIFDIICFNFILSICLKKYDNKLSLFDVNNLSNFSLIIVAFVHLYIKYSV